MNKDGIGKFTNINYFSEAEAYKKQLIENQDSPIVRKMLDYWNVEVFPSLCLASNPQSDEEDDSASDGLVAEDADAELDAVFHAIRLDDGSSCTTLSDKVPMPARQPQPIAVEAPAGSASTELIPTTTLVAPYMAPAAMPDSNAPPRAPKPKPRPTKNSKAPVAANIELVANESAGELVSTVIGETDVGLVPLTIPISTAVDAPPPQAKATRGARAKKTPAVMADPDLTAPPRRTRGAGARAKTNVNAK